MESEVKTGAVLTLLSNQSPNFNDKVAYKMLGCRILGILYVVVFLFGHLARFVGQSE